MPQPGHRRALDRLLESLPSTGGVPAMSWGRDPEYRRHRHDIPDRGGDAVIPGYAGREGVAKRYVNEPMSRDECERIMIAIGLVLDGYPVERRAIGEGFSILIPAEWWRDRHPGVKSILARGGRR
jgi:hypothetical protein